MKTKFACLFIALTVWLAINLQTTAVQAQGTAFTYQGRLNEGTSPANGSYDLRFALFDAASAGNQQGGPLTNTATSVSNGLFTVTLDFGNQFPGANRWLEIGVRTNGGGAFVNLTPRQKMTATPYAITASNLTGVLPVAQLSGSIGSANVGGTYGNAVTFNNPANSFGGNGGGLTNVNAATLGGLNSSNFWRTTGNGGTTPGANFIGTTDNQPLELKVNGQRALRLEFATNSSFGYSPNLIGGSPANFATGLGNVIAGGGGTGFGTNAIISGTHASISGGAGNLIQNSLDSVISGGQYNSVSNSGSAGIFSGGNNAIFNSGGSFIGGGGGLLIKDSTQSSISGGTSHTVVGSYTVGIGSGNGNSISNSDESFIGGGCVNQILESKSCGIASGWINTIQGESLLQQADSLWNFIGGGRVNLITSSESSAILGGWTNSISSAYHSSIVGGWLNLIDSADGAVIGGGYSNNIYGGATYATISGGHENTILANGKWGTIPGGWQNAATNFAFAAGRRAKAIHTGAFVWADSTNADFASTASNQFLIRAGGGVGIGKNNPGTALDVNGTVTATVFSGGGSGLTGLNASQLSGTIPSGTLSGTYSSTVTFNNVANSFTGNGAGLTSVNAANISSGTLTDARLSANVALLTGSQAFSGAKSFSSEVAATSGVRINNTNLWFKGDNNHGLGWYGSGRPFAGTSAIDGPVLFGFSGGALGTEQFGTEHIAVQWTATTVTVNGTFNNNSDRNAKERFNPISPAEILKKVAHLPITEWSYQADAATRHIGPMAQDFYSTFNVGTDEKHIAPIDEGGVVLAAIQGLNEKVEARIQEQESRNQNAEASIQKLEVENADLKKEISEIKALLAKFSIKKD